MKTRWLPRGWYCTHRRMRWCCAPKNYGHLICPDCGLAWDEAKELHW